MAAGRTNFRHGRIIGAYLRTRRGTKELHPAVILSADKEIVQPADFDPRGGDENFVVVIGVSTKYSLYADPFLKLPFQATGHRETRLTKDSAAIVGWYDVVHIPDECRFFAGDVPAPLMVRLNDLVRADIANRVGREYTMLAEILPMLFPT